MAEGVVIYNLNPGLIRHEMVRSLLSLLVYDINNNRHLVGITPMLAGPLMGVYRNMATEQFLTQTDGEWLFFLDSDIELKDNTIDRLLEIADPIEKPVVSGLYMMSLDEGLRPGMFRRIPDEKDPELIHMKAFEEIPEGIVEVDGCGAGCLLIHRSLLEAMLNVYGRPMPWFAEQVFDKVIYGEDFTFCMRVKQMGYKIYVDTDTTVGHVKQYVLDKSMFGLIDIQPHEVKPL